jgi:hypothetical protein
VAAPLIFPDRWFAAGVVTAESAADFARLAEADPSRSPRYWYWLAFRDYTEEKGPLSADECRSLYALGKSEPDANLGGAIVAHVLHERACPSDVREAETSHRN